MPTIRLTDQLGLVLDIKTPPLSTFAEYAKQAPQLVAGKLDLARARGLTLSEPALTAFGSELAFAQPVELGANAPELTFGAGIESRFEVIQRDPDLPALLASDEFGEEIEIPAGTSYFAVTLRARASGNVTGGTGALTLGFGPEGVIEAVGYRRFTEQTRLDVALSESIGGFTIPSRAEDLARIPEGGVVTVTGTGTLSFTATANLLAMVNPLATASLPAGLPGLSLAQAGSVEVAASYKIGGEHQVRVHRVGPRELLLGWYRRRGRELAVTADAVAGVTAGIGGTDLLSSVLRAISKNAAADFAELRSAGLSAEQTEAMQTAVREAVNRKLQLAVSASLSGGDSRGAAFLYRIDPEALDERGRAAVTRALGGDLSDLGAASLPAGIEEVHSILSDVRKARHSLHVNLLGIYNYGSLSRLMREGSVMFTPSTGELVIADSASSRAIRSSAVNFGADEEKLRRLLFGSLMITAAYTGVTSGVGEPALSCTHLYFILKADARRDDLRKYMRTLSALGLATDPDGAVPSGIEHFGRTTLLARTTYDGAVARGLFLTAAGTPRAVEEYENAGRQALAALLLPDGDAAFRLQPMRDDALWKRMKASGPPNRFNQLFADDFQTAQIAGDYLLIRWWADAMHGMGQALADLRQWFALHPTAPQDDAQFQKLRQTLAGHAEDVVHKLPAERWSFQVGEPWGLVALFLASGRTAGTEAKLISPLLTRMQERAIRTAAGT